MARSGHVVPLAGIQPCSCRESVRDSSRRISFQSAPARDTKAKLPPIPSSVVEGATVRSTIRDPSEPGGSEVLVAAMDAFEVTSSLLRGVEKFAVASGVVVVVEKTVGSVFRGTAGSPADVSVSVSVLQGVELRVESGG